MPYSVTWQNSEVSSAVPARVPHVPESVEAFFQWSLFALVACGFTALAATGQLDVSTIVFSTTALLARGVMMFRGVSWAIPESYSSYLAVLYALIFAADLFLISRDYVAATVHLVLFATAMKLFSVKRERDYLYLAMLAFLEVLAASVLTIDSTFLFAFSAFLLFAVTTFLGMELRRSFLRATPSSMVTTVPRIPRNMLIGIASGLVIGILVLGSVLFFMLPRKYGGYMSSLARSNQLVSGFSDSVDLGAIGEIQQSDQLVMHVKVLSPGVGIEGIRWRGVTLSSFDGRRWFNLPDYAPGPQFPQIDYFDLTTAQRNWDSEATRFATGKVPLGFRYQVSMEPIGTDVVFIPAKPESLTAPFRTIDRDFGQSVFDRDRTRGITTYVGQSDVSRPSPAELASSAGYTPTQVRERYLQLPHVDQRVVELARRVTQTDSSNYARAASIEKYLRTRYGYTLQLPKTEVDDPLINFLFVRQAGHCEYFASSMAVMLRTLGIPSRLVNGFRGTEYNDLTGSHIVRARNAHSWVEAYFPQHGWVEFDPTPPAADFLASGSGRILLYLDAAREFWREWVVDYDFLRQRQLGSMAATQSRHWVEDAVLWVRTRYKGMLQSARAWSNWISESGDKAVVAVFTGAGFMLLLSALPALLRAVRRRRILAGAAVRPSEAAALWYARMLRKVARRGWRKLPSQTPGEFANSISEHRLRERVTSFTECYERARFGRSAQDAVRLATLFGELAVDLRRPGVSKPAKLLIK